MPVNATIPLTQDFLETAASYPFLTELIQHPTDGYLYGCYHSSALFGSMVKVKADNFTDITTVDFANDGQHANPVDMVYVPSTDRFYVLFRNGDANRCVISAVTPSTLARTDFFNFTDIQVGAGSITADATNLYVVTFPTTPSYLVIIPIAAPGTFAEPTPLTGFSQAHCIRQFGGKLFAQGMTPPTTGWVMRLTTAGVVEETAIFTGEEGEFPVDEIGESAGHIWVGNRDLSGEIRKYSKTSFINPEVIPTTQLSKCTCVKTVGGFVWAAFENGRGVRINPDNVADRRIYTLNAGEGYHSEFTGGVEFVYTYNYFEGKIARYHIPPDIASGSMLWLVDVFGKLVGTTTGTAAINGTVVDQSGNIYGVGSLSGTVQVGEINGVPKILASEGAGENLLIAKWNSAGQLQWAERYGGNTRAVGNGVSIDSNNALVVTGVVGGIGNLGGGPLGGASTTYAFLAGYRSSDGGHEWSFLIGSSTGTSSGVGVVIDTSGNMFVTGNFFTRTNLGGGDINSAGGNDLFLAKYNSSRVVQWGFRYGTTTSDFVTGIAIDGAGNVLLSGYTWGSIDLGGGVRPQTGTSAFFIVKLLGSTGAWQWDHVIAPTGDSAQANCVTVDSGPNGGDVIIGGSFRGGSMTLSATVTITHPTASTSALFVIKYSNSGTLLYARALGGITSNNAGESAKAIKADANRNIIFTGTSNGDIDWGNSRFTLGNGSGALILGKLNSQLTTLTSPTTNTWPKRIAPSSGTMTILSIVLEPVTANAYISGSVEGTVSFGPGGDIVSPSFKDGYLVKYAF